MDKKVLINNQEIYEIKENAVKYWIKSIGDDEAVAKSYISALVDFLIKKELIDFDIEYVKRVLPTDSSID